jgi:hypothetical protein
MKLTKSELTQIIREIINEEAVDSGSLQKHIEDSVAKLNANDLRGLSKALSQGGDPGDDEMYVTKLLKKVTGGNATPVGIKKAMKQFDNLYFKIMGPLDNPDYGFMLLPGEKVREAAKKLILKLATIAVGK